MNHHSFLFQKVYNHSVITQETKIAVGELVALGGGLTLWTTDKLHGPLSSIPLFQLVKTADSKTLFPTIQIRTSYC